VEQSKCDSPIDRKRVNSGQTNAAWDSAEDIEVAQLSKTGTRPRVFRRSWTSWNHGAETNLYLQTGAHTVVAGANARSTIARPVIVYSSSSMWIKRIYSMPRRNSYLLSGYIDLFYANLVA